MNLKQFVTLHNYDYDKCNELIMNKNDRFSVLSTDIQSINSKFNELEAFIEELGKTNFKFSVIMFTGNLGI